MINVQAIKKRIELSPQSCGVYKMIGDQDKVLYVGKAKNLKSRLSDYLQFENLSERIRVMLSQVIEVEIFITKNEIEALLLEAQLIKSLKPTYNIVLKDGKFYPYITISKHDYPRIAKYRGKFKKNEFYYYGPFPSAAAVKNTILSLQRAFLLRVCSDQYFSSTKRPCIEYQIKRCSAPCVDKITKNNIWYNKLSALDKGSSPFWNISTILKKKSTNIPILKYNYNTFKTQQEKCDILAQISRSNHSITTNLRDSSTERDVENAVNHFSSLSP